MDEKKTNMLGIKSAKPIITCVAYESFNIIMALYLFNQSNNYFCGNYFRGLEKII